MNKTPRKKRTRKYESELRNEHAQRTADQILDAVGQVVSRGARTLSYAAIAKEARTSVPTVYRHFPKQSDLFTAFAARQSRDTMGDHAELKVSDYPEHIVKFYARFDDDKDLLRQQGGRVHVAWEFSRVATVPTRRLYIGKLLDEVAPHLPTRDREMIIEIGIVVFSSVIGEAFRGYLELSGKEIADRVAYLLELILSHAKNLSAAHEPK